MQLDLFYMSPERFSCLQKLCDRDASSGVKISGNDALSALVWRCMLKAKRKAALTGRRTTLASATQLAKTKARLFVTRDARPDISQPMPMLYLGDFFFVDICPMALEHSTTEKTILSEIAVESRQVLNQATPTTLLDAYTLAKEVPDRSSIRLDRGHTPASFDMVLSSLLMFPVEGVNF